MMSHVIHYNDLNDMKHHLATFIREMKQVETQFCVLLNLQKPNNNKNRHTIEHQLVEAKQT